MTDLILHQPEWTTFRTRIETLVKHLPSGAEFWSARDLQEFFEYSSWQKFENLVTRAVESVQTAGLCPEDHFNPTVKMVGTGSSASRPVMDYQVSRLGCYHLAMVADPGKEQAAFGRLYFTAQTRASELRPPAPALSDDPVTAQLQVMLQLREAQLSTDRKVEVQAQQLAEVRAELDQSPIVGKELGIIYNLGQHLGQLMGDYRRGWRLFKDRFGLASYRDLPRCKFEDGEHFLRVQIAAWGGTPLLREDQ